MTSVTEALSLIEQVIGPPTAEQRRARQELTERQHLSAMGLLPHEMDGITTKGGRNCGRTMYRRNDPKDGPVWVCSSCGDVE